MKACRYSCQISKSKSFGYNKLNKLLGKGEEKGGDKAPPDEHSSAGLNEVSAVLAGHSKFFTFTFSSK